MVREALMQTASNAATPDNHLGWGIVNLNAALDYKGQVEAAAMLQPDSVINYDPVFPVRVVASSLTAIDAAASTLYYRIDSGSYQPVALTAETGDTLSGAIPQPAAFFSTVDYYFVAKDTIGFAGQAPDPLGSAVTFVWQTVLAGDVNKDYVVTIADVLELVNFVFKSGSPPEPTEVGDVDGHAAINSSDIIFLVNYVFKGGTAPTLP